jgi:hypothetical protein
MLDETRGCVTVLKDRARQVGNTRLRAAVFKDVPPHLVRLASGCLDQAALASYEPADLAAAAERACGRLSNHLSHSLGRPRAHALLALGLTLAKADFPFLSSVDATADGHLVPLDAAVTCHPSAEVHAALVALLAHTLRLLATLEGDRAACRVAQALTAELTHD